MTKPPKRPPVSAAEAAPDDSPAASRAERRAARQAAKQAERAARQCEARARREAERQARRAARQSGVAVADDRPDDTPMPMPETACRAGAAAGTSSRATPGTARAEKCLPADEAATLAAPVKRRQSKAKPRIRTGTDTPPPDEKAPTVPAPKSVPQASAGAAPKTGTARTRRTSRKSPSADPAPARAAKPEAAAGRPPSARRRKDAVPPPQQFNILAVAQAGRLEWESLLLAASLRHAAPGFQGRLILAEPQPAGAWAGHATTVSPQMRAALEGLGAEVMPFTATTFGAAYPQGNKIEALALLPAGEPFLFLDSDNLITGPIDCLGLDLTRPTASMRREGTWPVEPLYGPQIEDIWRAIYARFDVSIDGSFDNEQPAGHWERYLYFNASWFFGPDPVPFHARYLRWAQALRAEPGDVLAAQVLEPWLDQIVLPLVIHSLGGGRPGLAEAPLDDGRALWHYRNLPLLYATAPAAVVDTLETVFSRPDLAPLWAGWTAAQRMIAQGEGRERVRPMFDRMRLPQREQIVRRRLKAEGLWLR